LIASAELDLIPACCRARPPTLSTSAVCPLCLHFFALQVQRRTALQRQHCPGHGRAGGRGQQAALGARGRQHGELSGGRLLATAAAQWPVSAVCCSLLRMPSAHLLFLSAVLR
jgi:hypothetical protein